MIAAIIILSVVAFIILMLLLPISIDVDYGVKTTVVLSYAGIKIFDSDKKKNLNAESLKDDERNKAKNPLLKFFKKQKAEKGFLGAVKFCFSIFNIILKKCFAIIKRVKIRRFRLDLIVATNDAAHTAIEYGAVCTAVYPPLSLLEQSGSLKAEKINVSADFDNNQSKISFSFIAKSNLLIFILCAIKGYFEYRKLEREWKK